MITDPSTLTCRQVVELVTEYLGETMPPEDRVALEQHLLVCPPCTAYIGQVRATIQLLGALEEAKAPAPPEELLELFRRLKARRT
jgi:predicted anti-sigma-YlaC factor YlaD